MDTVVDVDAGGRGFFTVRAGWGLGAEGVVSRRGTGIALSDHRDLRGKGREGTNAKAGGRNGDAVSQTGSGVAGSKTRRPCRQRSSRGLPDHAVLRARSTRAYPVTAPRYVIMMTNAPRNPGFLTDAPPPGRRGTLYWNLRRFRVGRRQDQTPYGLLGLKSPTWVSGSSSS